MEYQPLQRGEHGCIYCYARPTHEYLGFSAGLDFETQILVKHDAPELLRRALAAPRWQPQVLAMSGVTDPYQPVERRLLLTRRCLEVLAEFRNPVVIVTKSALVTRDVDVFKALAGDRAAAVFLSVTTLDGHLARLLEPRASQPARRLAAIETLAQAGVPVGEQYLDSLRRKDSLKGAGTTEICVRLENYSASHFEGSANMGHHSSPDSNSSFFRGGTAMSRSILSLSHEQLTAFDLDAFVAHADALNQHNRETFTTPFPKAPNRWLSHYAFIPRPLVLTREGDVEGGLSWLVGATLDFSFTRSLCAPHYGARGNCCYDPASLVVLEVAAKVDQYVDYAHFCGDLHQADKGRR